MPSAFLTNRSHFQITGAEAQDFLQGLITTDVENLEDGVAAPGALLTPQGKILFYFLISRTGEGFSLELTDRQADALAKRLTMYKLRSKVEIGMSDAVGTTIYWGDDAPAEGAKDLRFEKAGTSIWRQPGGDGNHHEDYDALRVEAFALEPESDFELGEVFPHDVMLDLNGGLSFKKGCYVGQEVVSRVQHRSTARRRPVIVSAETALPAAQTPITIDGKPIGALGTVAGKKGLAILRIDKAGAAMAAGTPMLAGDEAVTVALAPWSRLVFPQADEGE